MAHFAKIENGSVTQVIVVGDDDCAGGQYPEADAAGQAFIHSIGLDGEWKQTSYHGSFRSKYSGIGDLFVEDPEHPDGSYFASPAPAEVAPE